MALFPRGGVKGFFLPRGGGFAKFSGKHTFLSSEQVMKIPISFFKVLSLDFVQCFVCFTFSKIYYNRQLSIDLIIKI